jgi:DNA-binding transcriptional LysR family regulator
VVPTEAGRLFAASARELLGQYADAQRALQDRAQVPGGLVRINAPVYFGQRHIAPWLPELAARHPKLQFDLMLTDDFIDPHRDATDILFRISSLPDAGYHARVFGSQRYYLTASRVCFTVRQPDFAGGIASTSHAGVWRFAGSQPLAVSPARRGMGALSVDPAHDLEQCRCPAHFSHRRDGDRVISRLDGQRSAANGTLVTLMDRYSAAISHTPSYIAAIYPYTRHPSLNVRTVIDYFADVFGSPPYWQR